jgi:hypothetical protein
MSRFARALLLTAIGFCLIAPPASAATTSQLSATLGDLWTTVLQTPTPQNPFTGGDTCIALQGNIVAPFGPNGAPSCTVTSGTRIFVAAQSIECSSFPFDHEGFGTTEAELRACAIAMDAGITLVTLTVDGQPVPLTKVQTGALSIHLSQDNIFAVKGNDRTGLSVADGWVALLDPLALGTHTIEIVVKGKNAAGKPVNTHLTTTIIVQ